MNFAIAHLNQTESFGGAATEGSPEGCENLAGGRRPPESVLNSRHAERVQDSSAPASSQVLHPFRVPNVLPLFTGGYFLATLRVAWSGSFIYFPAQKKCA